MGLVRPAISASSTENDGQRILVYELQWYAEDIKGKKFALAVSPNFDEAAPEEASALYIRYI